MVLRWEYKYQASSPHLMDIISNSSTLPKYSKTTTSSSQHKYTPIIKCRPLPSPPSLPPWPSSPTPSSSRLLVEQVYRLDLPTSAFALIRVLEAAAPSRCPLESAVCDRYFLTYVSTNDCQGTFQETWTIKSVLWILVAVLAPFSCKSF